MKTSYISKN